MKKIISVLSIVAIASSSFAGTPPTAVEKSFQQKFPTAKNVSWGKENAKEWEAEFKLNDTKISANFLLDGTWVETETEIPVTQLPPAVATSIKKQYPDWQIAEADKMESRTKGNFYEADIKMGLKKKEVEIKEDGTLMK